MRPSQTLLRLVALHLGLLLLPPFARAEGGPGKAAAGQSDSNDVGWREQLSCGPNCLYIILSLHGYDTTFDQVRAVTPVGSRGCSLAELQRAATACGVPTEVVKATPGALRALGLPAVVHMETGSVRSGHFMVVSAIGEESVRLLDPTTAVAREMPRGEFERRWTSYALVIKPPAGVGSWVRLGCVAAGCSLLLFAWGWRKKPLPLGA